ncbi:glycosyl hydrolase [Anaerocolumna cellulosilytica]|uniref:beta-N-acetylhexosaminidase n=1 Tax=Anaerocolumna cellulosilytica TaxID=433286 RepID=A0A6S6R419_9FIRM|nr:glycoside hydrolase family 3 protein [Anaerocolumna cellulosilytica]MBB5194814.1 beta-N-acetylhexosaminidase [Anaerocolumna cellulosilytica]BCJ94222.1 glycosyl hydrolase [Anaerocolumna cellulosilytica]
MSVNLKAAPFNLNESDIMWVKDTISKMSLEEKIGQLFIVLGKSTDENYLRNLVEKYHIGGARYVETDPEKILVQNRFYQKISKIPMFIATNCEDGGSGACKGGTKVASGAQCAAMESDWAAYEMGKIGGREASALGCNWTFSPIVDIVYNWRNTIVNTRAFGNDSNQVLKLAKANIRGFKESSLLTCAKHFPGDGIEERDQHLVMGINDLSCEEWDESFGKVYKGLIEEGLETVMVGHIALPAYSKKLCPDLEETDIMPATLAKELVNGLLREQLGFNGLVLTDASHMGGLLSAKPRSLQVPGAIAAGCDMFLFFHDEEEDFNYMLEGYHKGIITEERLQEALERILGMKAKLGLHKQTEVPLEDAKKRLEIIGCEEHKKIAKAIADESITLVKDTQNLLPVDISSRKRARLYYMESAPVSNCEGTDPMKEVVKDELERAGFLVDTNKSYYEMECEQSSRFNRFKAMEMAKVEDFKKTYDIVFVFVHMKGYAQENNVRVKYSAPHSNELPWWIREVPTVCISLNYTNHLYDLPMMKTYINAYEPTRECIQAAIEKVIGKSEFKGIYNENVWCNRWDTRY